MSTFGKVLVVLVLLLIPVWIVMMSSVAQLNRNWAEQVEKLSAQVAKLEDDVKAAEVSIVALKEETGQEQVRMNQDLATLSARQASIEKSRSEMLENEMRVKYQVADIKDALKNAQSDLEIRTAERKDETEGLDTAKSKVEKLKGENTALMNQLTQLRNEFKQLLGSNKNLVNRPRKAAGPSPTRPASLAH